MPSELLYWPLHGIYLVTLWNINYASGEYLMGLFTKLLFEREKK